MGMSLNADLYYGICLGDGDSGGENLPSWAVLDYEAEELAEDAEEPSLHVWEDELARRRGIALPEWVDKAIDGEGHQQWLDGIRAKGAMIEALPVELDSTGTDSYTVWNVRVKASVTQAYYGAERVKTVEVQPEWRDQLRDFLTELELPFKANDFDWYIAPTWL